MFKNDFKYYKRRCPPPDFSGVIDFNCLSGNEARVNAREIVVFDIKQELLELGLKSLIEWRKYELTERKGLLFIPNPFTCEGQRYWVQRCLQDFTCKPHKLNLDAHGDLEEDQEWWDVCNKLQGTSEGKTLLHKLRWATLGYQHNWDTKVYSKEPQSPFPEDLASLCKCIARVVGYANFSAEAAIVNFYHMDSTLSGHTDHSELDNQAPLFSFSFGQSAIFLLGGPTPDEKPTALLIRSGDIVVMSEESRLCYHGVPRIVAADITPWTRPCDKMWETYQSYLSTSRINMNVRQVLPQRCNTSS